MTENNDFEGMDVRATCEYVSGRISKEKALMESNKRGFKRWSDEQDLLLLLGPDYKTEKTMEKENKEELYEAVYRVQIGYMVGGKRIPKGTKVTIVEYLDQGGRSKVQVRAENGRYYTMASDVFDAAFGYVFNNE